MDMDEAIKEVVRTRNALLGARHRLVSDHHGPIRFLAGETARYASRGVEADAKVTSVVATVNRQVEAFAAAIEIADDKLRVLHRLLNRLHAEAEESDKQRVQTARRLKV